MDAEHALSAALVMFTAAICLLLLYIFGGDIICWLDNNLAM